MKAKEFITEKWTKKYKSSINCSHPKGFSQKAHCAGKSKHTESIEMEMVCESCGMCQTHGNLNEIAKGAKDSNGVTKCWPGKHAEGTKKGKNGGQVRNCVPNESVAESEKKGLYYYVNKRKAAGTSRDADSPKAPTAQAWKDAAKTAKKEGVAEGKERCKQCGMTNCSCKPGTCKCKPIAGWIPNKGFKKAVDEDWNKVNHHDKTNGLSQKAVNAYRRENPGSKLKTAVTTKPSKLKPGSKAAKRRKSFCARMGGNKGPMKKPNGKPTPKALALRRWNCESIEQMAQMIEQGEQMISEMKQRLDPKCWTGKHKEGTKIKGGVRVNNCVPNKK